MKTPISFILAPFLILFMMRLSPRGMAFNVLSLQFSFPWAGHVGGTPYLTLLINVTLSSTSPSPSKIHMCSSGAEMGPGWDGEALPWRGDSSNFLQKPKHSRASVLYLASFKLKTHRTKLSSASCSQGISYHLFLTLASQIISS